jgi:hypothetical protein
VGGGLSAVRWTVVSACREAAHQFIEKRRRAGVGGLLLHRLTADGAVGCGRRDGGGGRSSPPWTETMVRALVRETLTVRAAATAWVTTSTPRFHAVLALNCLLCLLCIDNGGERVRRALYIPWGL